ncbi:hypothetical protein [Allomuricauda sp. d1]|uniref:hypothetical protein n=1 Tax=Allomuricauda sp. d1 TaxID=3136725 RepID=UPI0031D85522
MVYTIEEKQKIFPKAIEEEVRIALSYFPELKDTPIEFKFKENIKKSTMQAQPNFWSLLRPKKHRSYYVLISERFKISGKQFQTKDIPKDVMVGWLGHELGHIMDYKNRDALNMIWFGIRYLYSEDYIKKAEREADSHAVDMGMEKYILATKDFILNMAGISEAYKNRIKQYYLSPEEIMILVKERDTVKQLKKEMPLD